jgi:hypothetical protein
MDECLGRFQSIPVAGEEILADGRTGVFIKQEERARAEVLRATGSTIVLGERAGG